MDPISKHSLHAVYVTSNHSGTDLGAVERWLADHTELLANEDYFFVVRSARSHTELRDALLKFVSGWESLMVLEMKENVAIGSWGSDSIRRLSQYITINSDPS